MKTSWNDSEDDLLQGLPLRAQIIYLRGIRRYMNFSTGIAGQSSRRISLKSLAEVSESFNNRQIDQPTKNATRESLKQLKKVGLIERIEDKDYLIFFLPKADTTQSVQNNYNTTTTQQQHNNNTYSNTVETIFDVALSNNYNSTKKNEILQCAGTTTHIRTTGKQVTGRSREGEKNTASAKKAFVFPDWLNMTAWDEFEQHRKEIKKSLSDLARTKAINNLEGLTVGEQQEVIDYSIAGNYPGLYPDRIKQKSQNVNGKVNGSGLPKSQQQGNYGGKYNITTNDINSLDF